MDSLKPVKLNVIFQNIPRLINIIEQYTSSNIFRYYSAIIHENQESVAQVWLFLFPYSFLIRKTTNFRIAALVRLPDQGSTNFRITVQVSFSYSAQIIAGASLSVPDQNRCQFRCYGFGMDTLSRPGSYQKTCNKIQMFSCKLFYCEMDVYGGTLESGAQQSESLKLI